MITTLLNTLSAADSKSADSKISNSSSNYSKFLKEIHLEKLENKNSAKSSTSKNKQKVQVAKKVDEIKVLKKKNNILKETSNKYKYSLSEYKRRVTAVISNLKSEYSLYDNELFIYDFVFLKHGYINYAYVNKDKLIGIIEELTVRNNRKKLIKLKILKAENLLLLKDYKTLSAAVKNLEKDFDFKNKNINLKEESADQAITSASQQKTEVKENQLVAKNIYIKKITKKYLIVESR